MPDVDAQTAAAKVLWHTLSLDGFPAVSPYTSGHLTATPPS